MHEKKLLATDSAEQREKNRKLTLPDLRSPANRPNLEAYKKNSPRQTIRTAPRRNTRGPSVRTICAPPGACTRTGDSAFPDAMAAIATAQDPVPEDLVSPTPRSKNRACRSCTPSATTTSMFTPCLNSALR